MKTTRDNNAGFSLVELIVTIAVASVLVGGATIGASLVFSRDASRCATILNDALYSTRMDSMSKPGKYTIEIKDNNADASHSQYVAVVTCEIERPGESSEITRNTIYLEGESGRNTIDTITATLKKSDGNVSLIANHSDTLTFSFDKSKGCVNKDAGTDITEDGIIIFHITPTRGSNEADVSLITSTGKHTIGLY